MNLARLMDCLDPDFCDEIVAANHPYTQAVVIRSTGDHDSYVSDTRTNSDCRLLMQFREKAHAAFNDALLRWSQQIRDEHPIELMRCFYLPGVTGSLKTEHEGLNVLKYTEGQQYKWHSDAQPGLEATNRLISVITYLNDDFEGGETEMGGGLKYKPKKGKALIFPSNWNYPHRACPVIKGTKYAIVTWYRLSK